MENRPVILGKKWTLYSSGLKTIMREGRYRGKFEEGFLRIEDLKRGRKMEIPMEKVIEFKEVDGKVVEIFIK